MASQNALATLLEALAVEQARRRKAQFGGHDDPRQWLLDTLQAMAERLAPGGLLSKADASPMERLAALLYLPMSEAERAAETTELNGIFRELGVADLIVGPA
jgi:hypothetical protein